MNTEAPILGDAATGVDKISTAMNANVADAPLGSRPNDAGSDLSMSNSTDDENDAFYMSNTPKETLSEQDMREFTKKRKSPGPGSADDSVDDESIYGQAKKVKLDRESDEDVPLPIVEKDWSLLPAEVWHLIFTFLPPRTLGGLLRVNKLFNSYLHPFSTINVPHPSVSNALSVPILKPNAIWQASRRLFWPHMPTPLRGKAELEMWQLACSSACQHCGKLDIRQPRQGIDVLHLGPGADGVAVIWPFATRTCWSCLVQNSATVS
jgi:hypothetical protein